MNVFAVLVQKIGTVGITDYAQKALGDVVFVELPTKGSEVAKQGTLNFVRLWVISIMLKLVSTDQIGAVESVKGQLKYQLNVESQHSD